MTAMKAVGKKVLGKNVSSTALGKLVKKPEEPKGNL